MWEFSDRSAKENRLSYTSITVTQGLFDKQDKMP
jgi:hypothetical protein